jgi:N-acetyl-anhydromuramyl-L-alanine amidase AmpD
VRARAALAGLLAALALAPACRAPAAPSDRPSDRPTTVRFPAGNAIVVCGERVPVDAPVVLWTDEPFYDAYREEPRFVPQDPGTSPGTSPRTSPRTSPDEAARGKRYRPGREPRDERLRVLVEDQGWTRAWLAEQVDLLVLHYDACGTSRACFRVLQDERKLSAHFLLDLDGTIYQTLDLVDQAWHARAANPRAIGIEIANVGAYPPAERAARARWYEGSEHGTRVTLPPAHTDALRTLDFVARPARPELVRGAIHGATWVQHDFTPEQYESLAALAATLARVFPRIELDAPRDPAGHVRTDALSDEEEAAFGGVVGHSHLQTDKRDPGPAFDWERFLQQARARGVRP